MRQYYDDNPGVFRHQPSVWIEELLLRTEAEAQKMRRRLEAGALFADLADGSLRKNAVENGGRFHYHSLEKAIRPRLIPAIMAAHQDQLVGPLEVKGGYSVFRVMKHETASIEPYESARRRARALVRRKRENLSLEVLVKGLREKYASRIEIYGSALAEALPDSLQRG